jgi:predicted RNA-binding protein YlqC (UPF0109 family)
MNNTAELLIVEHMVRSIVHHPKLLEVKYRRSVSAIDTYIRAETSDVARLVGRGGSTINALSVIGKALVKPCRFQIWRIEPTVTGSSAVSSALPRFDREQVAGWLKQLAGVLFAQEVIDSVRWSEHENELVLTLINQPMDPKANGILVNAIMDTFEAIGHSRGLRGENRLRVRVAVAQKELLTATIRRVQPYG